MPAKNPQPPISFRPGLVLEAELRARGDNLNQTAKRLLHDYLLLLMLVRPRVDPDEAEALYHLWLDDPDLLVDGTRSTARLFALNDALTVTRHLVESEGLDLPTALREAGLVQQTRQQTSARTPASANTPDASADADSPANTRPS